MKVGRRGKDLAVRLPNSLVDELDLKAGNEIELSLISPGKLGVRVLTRNAPAD